MGIEHVSAIEEDEETTAAVPEDESSAEEADEAPAESDSGTDEAPAEDAELVVSIGDEPAEPAEEEGRAPEWLRDLRKANREKDRRIRELEQRIQQAAPGQQAQQIGPRPTLESCGYDEEAFSTKLDEWFEAKRKQDDAKRVQEQTEAERRKRWESRVEAVNKAGAALKVRNYEDAVQAFDDVFSIVQRGVVFDLTEDPKDAALLRVALGKNPSVAKKLATIDSPVRFAGAVAKILYKDLNVKPRKIAPAPDTPVRSSVAGATAVDAALARLQAEADRTGNRTKVAAYLRQKNQAKQAA